MSCSVTPGPCLSPQPSVRTRPDRPPHSQWEPSSQTHGRSPTPRCPSWTSRWRMPHGHRCLATADDLARWEPSGIPSAWRSPTGRRLIIWVCLVRCHTAVVKEVWTHVRLSGGCWPTSWRRLSRRTGRSGHCVRTGRSVTSSLTWRGDLPRPRWSGWSCSAKGGFRIYPVSAEHAKRSGKWTPEQMVARLREIAEIGTAPSESRTRTSSSTSCATISTSAGHSGGAALRAAHVGLDLVEKSNRHVVRRERHRDSR